MIRGLLGFFGPPLGVRGLTWSYRSEGVLEGACWVEGFFFGSFGGLLDLNRVWRVQEEVLSDAGSEEGPEV